MMEECTSRDDFARMQEMFEKGEHLKDEKNFNRASALIFKLIEKQSIPAQVHETLHAQLMAGKGEAVLIDMPQLMLRMRLVHDNSLERLEDIYNSVLNRVARNEGPSQPAASALYHYPQFFNEPRDAYMASMLHEMCEDVSEDPPERVQAFVGNVHVSPIARLWQTGSSSAEVHKPKKLDGRKKAITLDYVAQCRLADIYSLSDEKAEEKIAKHALLEALF